jgi:glycine cleavage system H protein
MLTALDFPEDLLYSPDALWLRDGGVGSARLGCNVFAAFEGATDVVFVKLPKSGARIEKGKPFGHVDLGDRTFELIAPVSGSILFPNTDLRGEPSLLASDCYGRGFLLEVEGIDKGEMDALLERDDAVAHYSRFAAEGALEATQVLAPGRPFASTLRVSAGGRTLVSARLLPPEGNEEFTPDWASGDAWQVDVTKAGATRRFRYEVLGEGSVAQEEVVKVRVLEAPPAGAPAPQLARTLYFRVADWTLAAWDEAPAHDPEAYVRRYNPRGRECWLSLGDPEDGWVFDHPRLPVSLEDEARDLPKGATKEEPAISHYVKFRGGLSRIEAEMRADIPREDGRGTERLLSLAVLERGAPWWRETARLLGEKELVKSKLVES